MSLYEVVYIVRPDVATNQVEALTKRFEEVVKENGGKIIKTEQWGLKTLAYRVNKHRKGYYTMLGLEANGSLISELERQMRNSDDVIRFLSIRNDELTTEPSIQMAAPRRRHNEDSKKEA